MKLNRSRKGLRLTAASLAAVALVVSGCSSTGGSQQTSSGDAAAGSGGAANVGSKAYTFAVITHETPGDTFWDKIKAGMNSAAKNHGITINYSNDPTAAGQATLIQNQVDSKVDGIATTLVTPDALAGAVKNATDAGIPVVGFNSGIDEFADLGALMYFGSDESLAGEQAGERAVEAGAKHVLCIIQAEGSVALENRCAGVLKGAPSTENLQVNGADLSSVTSTITAKLQQDPTIDYVITLGAPIALSAIQAKGAANSTAKIGTFDLNADATKAIQDGSLEFSIDQQPFLQGYLAVDSLWLYKENLNVIGGGEAVLTGPSFVDKTNVDAIAKLAAAGTR